MKKNFKKFYSGTFGYCCLHCIVFCFADAKWRWNSRWWRSTRQWKCQHSRWQRIFLPWKIHLVQMVGLRCESFCVGSWMFYSSIDFFYIMKDQWRLWSSYVWSSIPQCTHKKIFSKIFVTFYFILQKSIPIVPFVVKKLLIQ